ncbi:hypothetical protein [Trichocoleus sp. DQ-U1]|uniref:hypothetical protein n=1 Tax=Trichocoleus sp. DQ-U1 TaxID=2933926 RepID=UPI003298F4BA
MPIHFPNPPKIFQVEPQVQHIIVEIPTTKISSVTDLFGQGKQLDIKNQSKSLSLPSQETIIRRAEAIKGRYGFDITITYSYDLYQSNCAYRNLINKLESPGIYTSYGNAKSGTDKKVLASISPFNAKPIIYIPLQILSQTNVLSAMRQNNPKVMDYLDELRDNNLNDEEMLIMFRYIKNILDSDRRVLIYLPSAKYKGGLLSMSGDDIQFLREKIRKYINTFITSPIQRDMIGFTIEIGDKALLRDNDLEPVSRENGIIIVSPAYFKESR